MAKFGPGLSARADVVRHYAANGVKTDEDLRRLAGAVSGQRWLDRAVCPSHASPWEMIRAAFFRDPGEVLGVGNRAGHKTQSAGLLNALEMIARPGIQVAHAAASLAQSQRAQRWTSLYLTSPAVRAAGIVAQVYKWKARLPSGSFVEVTPATHTGLNAIHAQILILDEFELLKPALIDEAKLVPQSFDGFERGLLFVSSRKWRGGNVDRILYDRKFRHVKKVTWCYVDVAEPCPESRRGTVRKLYEVFPDPMDPAARPESFESFEGCAKCALQFDCRGALAESKGWAKIDDLAAEYATVDRATWRAQKRSLRVGEERGKVFGRFSRRRNVREMEPDPHAPIRLAVDFGGGKAATAVLYYQVIGPEVRVLAEYTSVGTGPDEDVPNTEGVLDDRFAGLFVDDAVADSASPQLIADWNKRTTRFILRPVAKPPTKRESVAALQALVDLPVGQTRYLVDPSCATHIEEMLGFHYRDRIEPREGSIRQADYADTRNDTVDAATYLALEAGGLAPSGPQVYVVGTASNRVESSEGPKGVEVPEFTYADYLGDKLGRLLRRSRS